MLSTLASLLATKLHFLPCSAESARDLDSAMSELHLEAWKAVGEWAPEFVGNRVLQSD